MIRFGILIGLLVATALCLAETAMVHGSDYSDAVAALNPDAYFRFDGSGAAGSDETGAHDFDTVEADITFNEAGPRPTDGFPGMDAANDAWDFPSGKRAQVIDYVPAAGEDPRTVVGWFNTDVTREQHGGAIDLFGWISNTRPANTFKGWTLKIQAGFDASSVPFVGALGYDVVALNILGREVHTTTTPIEPGDWHMVGVIYDGGVLGDAEIYVDGVLQDLVNDTGVTPADPDFNLSEPELDPTPYGFFIGRDLGGFAMDGRIDHVAVWDTALAPADVESLWCIAQGGECPGGGADFDKDGDVDGDDFLIWQQAFGTTSGATSNEGDADGDGDVDGDDFLKWQQDFGSSAGSGQGGASRVPEPQAFALALLTGLAVRYARRRYA